MTTATKSSINVNAIHRWILKAQAKQIDINSQNRDGITALMFACQSKQVALTKILLDIPGININLQDTKGRTALMYAMQANAINVVRELIAKPELDVNIPDTWGYTALIAQAKSGNAVMVEELLKARNINVNVSQNGSPAIRWALLGGHVDVAKALLKMPGIDLTVKNETGCTTPLSIGTLHVSLQCIEDLLTKPGIDMSQKNQILHHALNASQLRTAHLLWAIGAQENARQLSDEMEAAKEDGIAVFKKIMHCVNSANTDELMKFNAQGYSLMVEDERQHNPLHKAVMSNNVEFAKWLYSYNKLWIRQKNYQGDTPFDLIFGLWADQDPLWNDFMNQLDAEFEKDKEGALKKWVSEKAEFFKKGHEGFVKKE